MWMCRLVWAFIVSLSDEYPFYIGRLISCFWTEDCNSIKMVQCWTSMLMVMPNSNSKNKFCNIILFACIFSLLINLIIFIIKPVTGKATKKTIILRSACASVQSEWRRSFLAYPIGISTWLTGARKSLSPGGVRRRVHDARVSFWHHNVSIWGHFPSWTFHNWKYSYFIKILIK